MDELWKMRAKSMGNKKLGHRAYATRETDRWNRWTKTAKTEFAKVLKVETFLI
jgi:hypothetical protein